MQNNSIYNKICLAIFAAALTNPSISHAFSIPSAGDVGYGLYEFWHDVISTGAIGFIIVVLIVCYAIYWILKSNIWGAVACAVAAVLFITVEDIAVSMGLMFGC